MHLQFMRIPASATDHQRPRPPHRSRGRARGRGHAFAVLAAVRHIGSRINAYCPALTKINLFQVLNFSSQVPAKYPVPTDRIPHDAATSIMRCRSASMPRTGGADNPQLNLGGNNKDLIDRFLEKQSDKKTSRVSYFV